MKKEIKRFTIWSNDGKTMQSHTTYRITLAEDGWYRLEYLKSTGECFEWKRIGNYIWSDLGFLYTSDIFQNLFK